MDDRPQPADDAKDSKRGEFSASYKGGFWAARIDAQDTVAAIVAVEALAGALELVPSSVVAKGGRIAFEAREDFEIRWNEGRQYVSVKDRQVSKRDILDAIGDISRFMDEVDKLDQSIRLEASSLSTSARSLYEDIERLRTLRKSQVVEDQADASREFLAEHGVNAEDAQRLVVKERRVGQNPQTAMALYAHAIRNAVQVHNYGDMELGQLFDQLTNKVIRDRRKQRGILTLTELERIIIMPIVPIPIAQYQVDYLRTKFGYVRDLERRNKLRQEGALVARYARRLMREWRRKTFWDRFRDGMYRGPLPCLACGHALIANFNGRRGIACPDCGYQPFLTTFYACDCGGGAVVQLQPELSSFEFVRDSLSLLRESDIKCADCGRRPENEKFVARVFTLPIPYPIRRYPSATLIDWREKLGWIGARKFHREDGLEPHEALLSSSDQPPEPLSDDDS